MQNIREVQEYEESVRVLPGWRYISVTQDLETRGRKMQCCKGTCGIQEGDFVLK